MSALIKAATHPAVQTYQRLNADASEQTWNSATDKQKISAKARKTVITKFNELTASMSDKAAYDNFKALFDTNALSPVLMRAFVQLGNKFPSINTLKGWVKLFNKHDLNGLLPKNRGTVRKLHGWEAKALEEYHNARKPSQRKVARTLRGLGHATATDTNVQYFFASLPAELQEKSRWRIGNKLYRDSQREYNLRHTENLQVGDVYQGDGHTLDVYLKHPVNGALWRAELTVFMDWKSRYIVGWYVSNAESSFSTMAALSRGMSTYDHVPLILYIDNGCGFKSKLMNDDVSGFYASFGINVIFAIPGNAKAKGNVERFFRIVKEDLNKNFDTYCGHDMAPEASRLFQTKHIKKMEEQGIHIPTLEQWSEAFENWLIDYHNRPHPEYKNTTPAAMWAQLERTPVHDGNLLVKPRTTVHVTRASVTFKKRTYRAEYLHQFNGKKLIAEYDFKNDAAIRLFEPNGAYLCSADIVARKEGIPTSFIEQARLESQKAALKRIDNKRKLKEAEYRPLGYEHEQQLASLTDSAIEAEVAKLPVNTGTSSDFEMNELTNELLFGGSSELADSSDEPDLINYL